MDCATWAMANPVVGLTEVSRSRPSVPDQVPGPEHAPGLMGSIPKSFSIPAWVAGASMVCMSSLVILSLPEERMVRQQAASVNNGWMIHGQAPSVTPLDLVNDIGRLARSGFCLQSKMA